MELLIHKIVQAPNVFSYKSEIFWCTCLTSCASHNLCISVQLLSTVVQWSSNQSVAWKQSFWQQRNILGMHFPPTICSSRRGWKSVLAFRSWLLHLASKFGWFFFVFCFPWRFEKDIFLYYLSANTVFLVKDLQKSSEAIAIGTWKTVQGEDKVNYKLV